MDRTGQIFDGRYRLERRIGQGGMAAVHVARDRKLDKQVAVKVMSGGGGPKAAQRFVQEARAVSRVRHPNVVDVTDFGLADDGAAYLVMELLHGEDLAQTLEREGPLPWSRVGPIALQICAALAAAHRAAVIHRDIKPSNCFRIHSAGNPDFIKVLDFGIARVEDPRLRVVEPTTAGTVLGTPEYMAPEIAAGAEAGPATDLYAVGALMYKLLTGAAPFVGDTYRAVLSKQIFEPPVPPRRRAPACEIPEAVEALVLRALAKDPGERHADMSALAAAIADALPQRPAVELWLAPGVGAADPERDSPPDPGPAAAPAGPPLAPTRTLVRASAGEAGRTAPLAVDSRGPRRWPLVAGGLALALAGTLVGLRLATPPTPPQDMSEQEGPKEHDARDMSSGAGGPGRESGGAPRAAGEARAAVGPGDSGAAPDGAAAPAAEPPGDSSPATPERAGVVPGDSPGGHATPAAAQRPGDDSARGPSHAPQIVNGTPAGPPAGEPQRRRTPRFDADAARRELERAAARVQRCALDSDMLRGEIAVRVAIDADGGLAELTEAAGSRRIEAAALACMRRELAPVRLAPVAGEVVVRYAI